MDIGHSKSVLKDSLYSLAEPLRDTDTTTSQDGFHMVSPFLEALAHPVGPTLPQKLGCPLAVGPIRTFRFMHRFSSLDTQLSEPHLAQLHPGNLEHQAHQFVRFLLWYNLLI